MALYAIGDLHLSLTTDKSMEVFGPAWAGYMDRIAESLGRLTEDDVLVLAGDTSWGMTLEEAEADFHFLDQSPCQKWLVKGNHDYWWSTVSKMQRFFQEKGIRTLDFLHNGCVPYGEHALCGTRGWSVDETQGPQDAKILAREALRLDASCRAAQGRPILCFLHYPPAVPGHRHTPLTEVLSRWQVGRCFYGHLHGPAIPHRLEGDLDGTELSLISADHLGFVPRKILDGPSDPGARIS